MKNFIDILHSKEWLSRKGKLSFVLGLNSESSKLEIADLHNLKNILISNIKKDSRLVEAILLSLASKLSSKELEIEIIYFNKILSKDFLFLKHIAKPIIYKVSNTFLALNKIQRQINFREKTLEQECTLPKKSKTKSPCGVVLILGF